MNQDEKKLQDTLEQMEERAEEGEQEELARKNKMGTMPVGPLLANMSIPIIISMLVQAMYNIVDSIFVARLGEAALAGVGLVFPVQNLMIAVAVGTGVGINSRLSRRLGERNVESANRVAQNGLFLSLLSYLLFAVIGLVGTVPFIGAFTNDAVMAQAATDYMYIVTIGSLGIFMSITLERLLTATGRTMYSMVSQLTGAVVNIVLDPILIFGWLGLPAMGVAGAAWATIIGQWVSMGVGIWANVFKNKEIRIHMHRFRPSLTTIRHIYQVGLPSIVMQSIGSVMTFGMNKILVDYGTTAVSVFSIYFKLNGFVFMPVFGLCNGMVPIVAFNYGAKNRERILKTVKLSVIACIVILSIGTLLFWLIPGQLLSLFDASENMLAIGTSALRAISLGFPLAAVGIALSSVFQALGRGTYSLIISMARQLVVLLPLAWFFSRLSGLDHIWYAFPLAEIVSLVLTLYFYRVTWKRQIQPLNTRTQLD